MCLALSTRPDLISDEKHANNHPRHALIASELGGGEPTVLSESPPRWYKDQFVEQRRTYPPLLPSQCPPSSMPTPPFHVVFLDLSASSEDPVENPIPFSSEEFADITQCDEAPWSSEATAESTGLSLDDLAALKAYCRKYFTISEKDRHTFAMAREFPGRTAYDLKGRDVLREWFAVHWKQWALNAIIDEEFNNQNLGMYSIAAINGDTVRHASDRYVRIS